MFRCPNGHSCRCGPPFSLAAAPEGGGSSDYLLDKLAVDHATTQKRLGDGFYEQRLVREQLSELTGRAPSAGPGDDALYKKMLNSVASFAQEFGLRPGISLSPEQVSHLTSDIVWLESQTVQLPDGSIETVLVPKVYLTHVNANASNQPVHWSPGPLW